MAVKKEHSKCLETFNPVRDAMDIVSGKWKLAIMISIGMGNDRFTDIQDNMPGIMPKVLATKLKT